MKKSRFTEEQIVRILEEAEAGQETPGSPVIGPGGLVCTYLCVRSQGKDRAPGARSGLSLMV